MRYNNRIFRDWFVPCSIALLALVASLGGFLNPDLYRDNVFVRSAWKGNDIVTAFLAAPMLAISSLFAARGSIRARLAMVGGLDYMVYNYAFYLFGAAFNAFFLLYALIVALSLMELIHSAGSFPVKRLRLPRHRLPVRGIAQAYMGTVAIGLTAIYVIVSLGFIGSGAVPEIVERTGHPTSVVFGLDLTLLVPFFILGIIYLAKGNPWGMLIAGAGCVKGTLYTAVLVAGSIFARKAGIEGAEKEVPLWIGLTLAGLVAAIALYVSLDVKEGEA